MNFYYNHLVSTFLIALFLTGCYQEGPVGPDWYDSKEVQGLLGGYSLDILNGYYEQRQQNSPAISAILIFSGAKLSVFSSDMNHSLLSGTKEGNGISYIGYSKSMFSPTGFSYIKITISDSILFQIKSGNIPKDFSLVETIGTYPKKSDSACFEYKEAFPKKVEFMTFGHRGGAAENTSFPAPENSLEICSLVSCYGANGAEIDVRMTKDKVPVLFHDENLTPRTIQSQLCVGKLSNYTYSHLKEFCRLYNGEPIPKLDEFLDYALNHTSLNFIWLDIKDTSTTDKVIEIQKKFNNLAVEICRDFTVYFGIPDIDIYNAYLKSKNKYDCPAICEISPELTIKSGAKIWAPRWTLGIMEDDIQKLKGLGIKTIFWTVDDPVTIKKIISKTSASGICTDFPQFVFYTKYAK